MDKENFFPYGKFLFLHTAKLSECKFFTLYGMKTVGTTHHRISSMRNAVVFFLLMVFGKVCFAQEIDSTALDSSYNIVYIPKYEWSIGLEHSYVPGIFIPDGSTPDNVEIAGWITQRYYWQAGAFHVHAIDQFIEADSVLNLPADTISKSVYFQAGYAFYVGTALKLFLFRNAYFTPSLNLYFDKYEGNPNENWLISIGPTAAVEYFIFNRISIRADFFNFNFGVGGSGNFLVTTHRILGLGIRYNFDIKRQDK
jgi:hypothetical protein